MFRTATPLIYKTRGFLFWWKFSRSAINPGLAPDSDFLTICQSVCGVSIVKDYYKLQKFNVMEIANKKNRADQVEESGSRVSQIPKFTESNEVT